MMYADFPGPEPTPAILFECICAVWGAFGRSLEHWTAVPIARSAVLGRGEGRSSEIEGGVEDGVERQARQPS